MGQSQEDWEAAVSLFAQDFALTVISESMKELGLELEEEVEGVSEPQESDQEVLPVLMDALTSAHPPKRPMGSPSRKTKTRPPDAPVPGVRDNDIPPPEPSPRREWLADSPPRPKQVPDVMYGSPAAALSRHARVHQWEREKQKEAAKEVLRWKREAESRRKKVKEKEERRAAAIKAEIDKLFARHKKEMDHWRELEEKDKERKRQCMHRRHQQKMDDIKKKEAQQFVRKLTKLREVEHDKASVRHRPPATKEPPEAAPSHEAGHRRRLPIAELHLDEHAKAYDNRKHTSSKEQHHKAPFGVGDGHRLPPIAPDRSRVAQRVIEADRRQKQQAVLRAKEARFRRQQQEAYGRLVQQYYAPAPKQHHQHQSFDPYGGGSKHELTFEYPVFGPRLPPVYDQPEEDISYQERPVMAAKPPPIAVYGQGRDAPLSPLTSSAGRILLDELT